MGNDLITWGRLAIDDLKASRILYANGFHRASFSLFQQGVEKAVKVFSLKTGLLSVDQFKKVGHNVVKLALKEMQRVRELPEDSIIPSQAIKAVEFLEKWDFESSLKLSEDNLSEVVTAIKESKTLNIDLSKFPLDTTRKFILNCMSKLYGKNKRVLAEITEFVSGDNFEQMYVTIMPQLMNILDEMFCFFGLYCCALITTGHNDFTRYPINGTDPMELYNPQLSLIKFQLDFIELAENSLEKILPKTNE